jgi:hypothetical protein
MFNFKKYEPGVFVLAPNADRKIDELLLRKGEKFL